MTPKTIKPMRPEKRPPIEPKMPSRRFLPASTKSLRPLKLIPELLVVLLGLPWSPVSFAGGGGGTMFWTVSLHVLDVSVSSSWFSSRPAVKSCAVHVL